MLKNAALVAWYVTLLAVAAGVLVFLLVWVLRTGMYAALVILAGAALVWLLRRPWALIGLFIGLHL